MNSFYGNIKFNNQTPLIYDKIYTSRSQMEDECHSDGIFNGRYVLVSYGDIRYTPYHKIEPMNEVDFANAIKAGNIYYIVETTTIDNVTTSRFIETTEYKAGQDYYIRTVYSIDEASDFAKNKAIDEARYNHDYHSTVWQKIWTSTQDSDNIEEKYIMVSHLNAETPKVTMIVDAPNDRMEFDKTNQVYFLVPTNQHALNVPGAMSKVDYDKMDKDNLFIRSDIMIDGEYKFTPVSSIQGATWDIDTVYYIYKNEVYEKYPDSKPYVDGMISEELFINLTKDRGIPLFVLSDEGEYNLATSWDRLTKYYFMRYRETEGRPHFDPIMSTDLDYRFHMPRNWKWDKNLDFDYNKAGFNPAQANDTNTQNNEIYLTEKSSGDEYPEHRFDEPSSAKYDKDLNIIKSVQPDMKHFNFNMRMLGDAVSKMWDKVYPRVQPDNPNSIRDVYIGNDRLRPENDQENFPETLAEAVRKLYYWLGLETDNNFVQGPWVDPETGEQVDTIYGVLNGASDLLGSFGDTFSDELFIPIASPYYPDGFGHFKEDENFTQLTLEEFQLLHNGGAGPLYIKKEDGTYEQATEYDYNEQYYRNMNSLLALLRAWQDIVKDTQADWTYDKGHIDWDEYNPLHPRFIRNKPVVLTVDDTAQDESSINWYWKNYAL